MPPRRAFLIAALAVGGVLPAGAATLRLAKGLVQWRAAGGQKWSPVGTLPRELKTGDSLRTGFNASALVELSGGSLATAEGNAHLFVEDDGRRAAVAALFGSVRVEARLSGGRAVSARTPVGVVRAREDQSVFRVTVAGGGAATIVVERGQAGVEDNRGRQLSLRTGERVEIDAGGLREAAEAPPPAQARREDLATRARRELTLDLARDAELAAALRESRREETQSGRVLADADGARLRSEEYVVRPSADRVVLVTLNGRRDGLSYFSWDGRFDRALPRDLAPVLGGLAGGAAATPWTVVSYTSTRSNGRDRLVELAAGGHQVDLNANADPADDPDALFDAAAGRYVAAPGAAFKTLFDRYGLYVNGVLKRGWTGANLQTYADRTPSVNNDPITGAALAQPLPIAVVNATLPDAGAARRRTLESYGDGTELARDDVALRGPAGGAGPRSALGAEADGDGLRGRLVPWGLEQRITASEFSGPIRLVLSAHGQVVTGGLEP